MSGKGAALGHGALEFPNFDHCQRRTVQPGPADLGEGGWHHQVVDEVSVVLEADVARRDRDMVSRQNAVKHVFQEAAAIKLLGSPAENILGLERVCHYHPR